MSEIAERGSIYDRIVDEKWSTTPDMGEYMNNTIFLNNLKGMSESVDKIGPEFYVENPIVSTTGYNSNLNVLAFNVKHQEVYSSNMDEMSTDNNIFDGDTVYLDLNHVVDNQKSFQVHYDTETVFKGIKDYLGQTLKISEYSLDENDDKTYDDKRYDNSSFGLRFIGINAPESIHYGYYRTDYHDTDVFKTTYGKLINNSQNVSLSQSNSLLDVSVNKKNIVFSPYAEEVKIVDGVSSVSYRERSEDEEVTLIKMVYNKKDYPSLDVDERIVYHEVAKNTREQDEDSNSNSTQKVKIRRLVTYVDDEVFTQGVDYANQSKKAQSIVKETFKQASEIMVVVDTVGLNGVKSEIPTMYKKSYESSANNPFYVLWDMWKSFVGKKYAYKYASYQVPGIEANGRFLAAIYAKVTHNGVSQWINLNKKVLYECSKAVARPAYSDSVDSINNNNYLSNGFKLWTYDIKKQLYMDGVSEDLYNTKDDRAEIQQQICGVNLNEMTDHTVMIGDCLFMIPPTSIKVTSQTKVSQTHLIRAKGSVQKQLPRTERIIQLDLYFNGEEGINGVPIERELPNGSKKVYYMNGLRSLIAQFKLTPFMPIHNSYINEVLGIDAVALGSYSVNTVPNYPRTLQVTLMMYEFAWFQYMPSQAVPLTEGNTLYKNGFSETIHFPLLRYYYQQALERGADLVSSNYEGVKPNDPRYIEATIGNKTSLQPIKFMHPTIEFYVPQEDLLKEKKQLKIAMQTRPLGQVFSFNDSQEKFIAKMFYVNKFIEEVKYEMDKNAKPLTTVENSEYEVGLNPTFNSSYKPYTEGAELGHFKQNKKVKAMTELRKEYLEVLNNNIIEAFNKYRYNIGDVISSIELVHRTYKYSDVRYYDISFRAYINKNFFEDSSDLDEIKKYCSKYSGDSLVYTEMFTDNALNVSYVAEFSDKTVSTNFYRMAKPLAFQTNDSLKAVRFLSSFSDENTDGSQIFEMKDVLDNLKDSMDVEDADSIAFEKFSLKNSTPIVTNVTATYNNIFANVGLKAIDGHAAQFTGGSDTTLEIEMIGDEQAVSMLNTLHRKCVQYLIDYRKILLSSPLRIDSEITRLLSMYEMTIESIQFNTIPEYPGRYNILLRLNSVDRTLRNRESLNKLKDIDNSQMQYNQVAQTKSYFDLKQALGKAELYPDLELPTITELEQAGFYYLKSKYQPERVYPDPDFYFLYWYPTVAENIRTALTEYFSEPNNFNYTISGDLFKDTIDLQLKVKNGNGQSFYEVLNWTDDTAYSTMVEDIKKLSASINDKDKTLSEDEEQAVADTIVGSLLQIKDLNAKIMTLQEVLEQTSYNTYLVNSLTNVTVKDYESLDFKSKSNSSDIERINKKIKEVIIEELKTPIKNYEKASISFKSNYHDATIGENKREFFENLFKAMFDTEDKIDNIDYQYIATLIRAAAVGYNAKQPFYSSSKPNKEKEDNLCFPPEKATITDEKGETVQVPLCYYPAENGEVLIAHNESTREQGIVFGQFAIKKYDGSHLSQLFKTSKLSSGFLDPYYNKDLHLIMFKKELSDEDYNNRLNQYRDRILNQPVYCQMAHFRQVLVWLYVLLDENVYLGSTILATSKMLKAVKQWDDSRKDKSNDAVISELANLIVGDVLQDEDEKVASVTYSKITEDDDENTYNPYTNDAGLKRYDDQIDAVLGDGSASNLKDGIKTQEEVLNQLFIDVQKQIKDYVPTLAHGLIFSLSSIAMSGLTSSILGAIRQGSLSEYKKIMDACLSNNSLNDLSEEEKRITKFSQYACYYLDEEKRHIKPDYQQISYNNKIQRAYLAAANNPSLYLLHSYYDMVMNDKRGSMARAFPTYYMLLIDEGRTIGYWKLQDNFYNMNSISEFEVVKSRKIAADTARIVMSNMYGVFNADDEDMKDENEYTMRDVWDSIFSPRTYFQKEYDRRENARDINYAKMQPGARVHLRMGYSSNAAELPIVFNGSVAEFENGEVMTLVCQGDGVELANPHMFNALDASDVEDIKYSDEFFGFKQFLEKWNSLSTPRSMLVTPLSAEGTWIQQFIKKWSKGRFFNSNPFGIVHFGDKRYTDIFTADGEVEQNIYEGLSTPTWDFEKCNMKDIKYSGLSQEYGLTEAPSVKVSLTSGFSYWDLMHIASSLSPDFISAIAPFQLRSTIFHGHPRFYYAYDYVEQDGYVVEKRKPFQQCHIYTSFNDIIDNRITTSSTNVRTNAVGHYVGPSWLTSEPKTVGPLFVDIDIFPEYQQSTSVNLNYEYKNSDFMPFNIPIADKVIDSFDWTSKPNGERTAWRATANALKDCIKEMYQGELIVLGDPSVKPFDRITIADSYEDISGTAEVETVVHMFSVDTGFTTSITPDCISAIDNNYETMYNAMNSQLLVPCVIADLLLVKSNIYFHTVNRPLYLNISRMINKGVEITNDALNSLITAVGKEALQNDIAVMGSSMPKVVRDFLNIDQKDIELVDLLSDLMKGKSVFNTTKVTGAKSLIAIIDDLDNMDDILKSVSQEKLDALIKLLEDDRYSKTKVAESLKSTSKFKDSIATLSKNLSLNGDEMANVVKVLNELNADDDSIKAAKTILESAIKDGKVIDFTTSEGKKVLKGLKAVGNHTDDFTGTAAGLANVLGTKADNIKKNLKIMNELDDIVSSAKVVKSGASMKTLIMNNLLAFAVDLVITKSAQEYLTKALRNLQVLTIYPLKKDGKVWTAGLNGHQGSVFGSLTYDEPGWLENLAIKFFTYGDNASFKSVSKYIGFLRDVFISTPEMKDIVSSYKRSSGYTIESHSDEKNSIEIQTSISENLALKDIQSYSDYKNIYFTRRLEMLDIKDKTDEAKISYVTNKIFSDDIEQDTTITSKVQNIFESSEVLQKLYKKDCFKLAYDFSNSDIEKNEKLGLTIKKIPIYNGGGAVQETYVKEIGNKIPKVYDIPYLRPDAITLLHHIIRKVLEDIQPDYKQNTCTFEEIAKHPFILHSATMVNSSEGWRSTGYLFTLEVKNYDNFSNIINEIEQEKDLILKNTSSTSTPFTIANGASNGYNSNTYTFFVHCPIE